MPLPKWPEELPFAVEWQKGKFSDFSRWRLAFPSGKAVALATMWDGPYSVQELADGNYVLKREREKEHEIPTKLYRVRPGDECVDMLFRDDWQEIPTDILQVTAWGSLGIRGRNADEEEVCGTNSMPVGTTLEGMKPVGLLMGNGVFAKASADAVPVLAVAPTEDWYVESEPDREIAACRPGTLRLSELDVHVFSLFVILCFPKKTVFPQ